jgi:Domain of unknown function (DUF4266)
MSLQMTVRLLAVAVALTTGGCRTVAPYERGQLMQRSMQAKPALDEAGDVHVFELRESALGASQGDNASCGCR